MCLDSSPSDQNGSQIWMMFKSYFPLLQIHLMWILGNGKLIHIWVDNIMGNPPIQRDLSLLPLIHWLVNQGNFFLFEISLWDSPFGCWVGWFFGDPPSPLSSLIHSLFVSIIVLQISLSYRY